MNLFPNLYSLKQQPNAIYYLKGIASKRISLDPTLTKKLFSNAIILLKTESQNATPISSKI